MQPWAIAARVAERQHGVVAVWQLRAIGISDRAMQVVIDTHGHERLGHGVIGLAGPKTPLRSLAAAFLAYSYPTGAELRVQARYAELREGCSADQANGQDLLVEAVVAAAMESGTIVCGPSAAWLHGLVDRPPPEHHLRLPRASSRVARKGVKLRFGELPQEWTTTAQGFPVSDVAQCHLEVAAAPGPKLPKVYEIVRMFVTAHRKRLLTLDRLQDRLAAARPCRGAPVVESALARLQSDASHSGSERRGRAIVRKVAEEFGLTVHPEPLPIMLGDRVVGEADIPVMEIRLDFEVDGPHHLLQIAQDQERDRLVRKATWAVERFPSELVDLQPKVFEARVRDAMITRMHRVGF